jgi:hypothetical protein
VKLLPARRLVTAPDTIMAHGRGVETVQCVESRSLVRLRQMPMRPDAFRGRRLGAAVAGRKRLMAAWRLAGAFRRSTRFPVPVDAVEKPLQRFFLVGGRWNAWREGASPSGECRFISS